MTSLSPAIAHDANAERRRPQLQALNPAEKESVLELLYSERFQDQAPREVFATLLDASLYVCHWRSMYRFLAQNKQVRERRDVLVHPPMSKPEQVATQPNKLWSWDITKLLGPTKHAF